MLVTRWWMGCVCAASVAACSTVSPSDPTVAWPSPAPPVDGEVSPEQIPPVESGQPRLGWAIVGRPMVTPLVAGAELLECSIGDGSHELQMRAVMFEAGRCDLRVVDQPGSWAGAGAIRAAMDRVGAVAGVNGGFFTPGFEPMGLVVADGNSLGRFQSSGLISGAVGSGARGPILIWNSELAEAGDFSQLLQAGPRLVDRGEPVGGLSEGKTATRTFVATDGEGRWAVGTVASPSLKQLAEVLSSPRLFAGLRVWRALNLDGGRSSSLWARRADGEELTWIGWSTVRNFLAIVPR